MYIGCCDMGTRLAAAFQRRHCQPCPLNLGTRHRGGHFLNKGTRHGDSMVGGGAATAQTYRMSMVATTAILVLCCIVAALPRAVVGEGDLLTNCTELGSGCTENGTAHCGQFGPCLNQGTCIELPGSAAFTCVCSGGWTGTICDTGIDACASDPCLNGATCMDLGPSDSQEDGFRCECADGWGGGSCGLCYIANCEACTGSPAACVVCKDGYRLNQTTASCGEFVPLHT